MPRATPVIVAVVSVALGWCLADEHISMVPQVWAAQTRSSNAAAKPTLRRSLTFTLENESVTGTVPFGSELTLGINLSGGAPTSNPLVAVVEGPGIDRLMVPLEPTEAPSHWKASVAIKPQPLGYTSVRPKALRVRVTISQVRGNTLLRLIGRSAYLTLAHDQPEAPSAQEGEATDTEVELVAASFTASGDEIQPDVAPVANALIAEEDLKPLPEARGQQAYWKEVSRLISRSWGQKVRYAKGINAARETVKVGFRMHPNGEAQLIQVERTSGVREIDEAGLLAIVHAHPFPALREAADDEVVDVHVRMRTGARRPAAVQQASSGTAPVEVQPAPPTPSKQATDSKPTP